MMHLIAASGCICSIISTEPPTKPLEAPSLVAVYFNNMSICPLAIQHVNCFQEDSLTGDVR